MVTEPVYPKVASDGSLVVPIRPPETREAIAVADYPGPVRGERVVVLQATAWVFDVRAVSEKHVDGRGRMVVDVVHEEAYYAGHLSDPTTLNAEIVFVERPRAASVGHGV
ncbi:hypothetical protein [Aquipuribacter sp. MA13-6]|uniref:hypothetical protein n=1 Tax=unclassified Aquipuribacter TaxID=2635084 RepID=UPI003EEBC1D4